MKCFLFIKGCIEAYMVEFSELSDDEPPPLEEVVSAVAEKLNAEESPYFLPSEELFESYAMPISAELAYDTLSSAVSNTPQDLETMIVLPPFEESDADFGSHLIQYICTIGPIVCDDPLYAVAEDRDEGPKIMFKFLRTREEKNNQAETRSYSLVLGYYLAGTKL
ncbi:hypothetical protein HYX14_06590 [Candidatus Woesearchaeota archaeon]|nr:hypothetical protein [Candidatus Woesearchaeota archaeon]